MPAPYSTDLRLRIVHAVIHQKLKYEVVSKLFGISIASIKRYVKKYREHQNVEPKKYRHGKIPAITDEMLPDLADFVQKYHQDSTIREIAEAYSKKLGQATFKKDVMHRALTRAGFTYKKKFQGFRSFK